MRYDTLGNKICVSKEIRTELPNGRVEIKNLYEDGFTYKYTYIPYWHPYELRHYFRDYKAYSPNSYIRLGRKLKELNLLNFDSDNYDLKKVLDAIAKFIPMNLKLFNYDSISKADNRTLKEIYKTRENLRLDMNNWIS